MGILIGRKSQKIYTKILIKKNNIVHVYLTILYCDTSKGREKNIK